MFLIIVDAHSKWPEVVEMKSTTAAQTIMELRKVFSVHGIPEQVVSDNGPQFSSAEFSQFCKVNGVKHIRVSPYHPASNGLAERFVQTFKKAMKRGVKDGVPFELHLASFLLSYRTTAHGTTDAPPCMLLMGRSLRTRLDMLRPDTGARVLEKQVQQKQQHDTHAYERTLHIGQSVVARAFSGSSRWLPGVVTRRLGPLTYLIRLTDGTVWRRHLDQLRERGDVSEIEPTEGETEFPQKEGPLESPEIQPMTPTIPETPTEPLKTDIPTVPLEISENQSTSESLSETSMLPPRVPTPTSQTIDIPIQPRRSGRKRQKPDRYRSKW